MDEFEGFPVEIIRKPYQKHLNLRVEFCGKIRISCNLSTSIRVISEFLAEQRSWILKKQHSFEKLRQRYPKKTFSEGEHFFFLGEQKSLSFYRCSELLHIQFHQNELQVFIPEKQWNESFSSTPHPELHKHIVSFYKKEGCRFLKDRVLFWSKEMGLIPEEVRFKKMKSAWGSCSRRGKITFNWSLIAAKREIIDYVVIHELAHIRFHDHSDDFWFFIKQFCPNYEEYKKWLVKNDIYFHFLDE